MSICAATARIQERIDAAALRSGRRAGDVRLMAAVKTRSKEEILDVLQAGVRVLGENRIQEGLAHLEALGEGVRPTFSSHFIGRLQSNKAKKAVQALRLHRQRRFGAPGPNPLPSRDGVWAFLVKSCSRSTSARRARRAAWNRRRCRPSPRPSPVFRASPSRDSWASALSTLIPRRHDRYYRKLSELFGKSAATNGPPHFTALSMGMSHDFEVAVEEGATLVRLGEALFGPRRSRMTTRKPLSPIEIQSNEFRKVFRGFDPEEVRLFLQAVAESHQALILEKGQLAQSVGAPPGRPRRVPPARERPQGRPLHGPAHRGGGENPGHARGAEHRAGGPGPRRGLRPAGPASGPPDGAGHHGPEDRAGERPQLPEGAPPAHPEPPRGPRTEGRGRGQRPSSRKRTLERRLRPPGRTHRLPRRPATPRPPGWARLCRQLPTIADAAVGVKDGLVTFVGPYAEVAGASASSSPGRPGPDGPPGVRGPPHPRALPGRPAQRAGPCASRARATWRSAGRAAAS